MFSVIARQTGDRAGRPEGLALPLGQKTKFGLDSAHLWYSHCTVQTNLSPCWYETLCDALERNHLPWKSFENCTLIDIDTCWSVTADKAGANLTRFQSVNSDDGSSNWAAAFLLSSWFFFPTSDWTLMRSTIFLSRNETNWRPVTSLILFQVIFATLPGWEAIAHLTPPIFQCCNLTPSLGLRVMQVCQKNCRAPWHCPIFLAIILNIDGGDMWAATVKLSVGWPDIPPD